MHSLSITFNGPFVYSIEATSVNVYAAKCADHMAGVTTGKNEYPIYGLYKKGGSHVYKFSGAGVVNNTAAITYLPAAPHSAGGFLDAPSGTNPAPDKTYFVLNLPKPKVIYGIHAVPVRAMGAKNDTLLPWATGARFYYDCDLSKQITLTPPFGPAVELTPPSGADPATPQLPPFGEITVEYRGADAGDLEHKDAQECFAEMADMLGLDWWLQHEQSYSGALAKPGGDCKAVNIIVGR